MVIKGKGDYKMSLQSPNEKQENQKSNKFTDFANKTKSKWGTLSKNQKIITSVVAAVVVIIAGAVIYQGISGNSITSVVSGSNLDVEVNSAEVIIPYIAVLTLLIISHLRIKEIKQLILLIFN